MLGKYLNPQNDVAFKRLFGTERNKDILLHMLNSVLANQLLKPISGITFLPTILEPNALAAKQSIVDVLCTDQKGNRYIVEMQVTEAGNFQKRAQYYASRAYGDQLKKGGRYEDLKEVIFLAFCNFDIFPAKQAYKSEHVILDKATGEHDLQDFSFTFINLPKFDKQRSQELATLTLEEKFYYFLLHAPDVTLKQVHALAANDQVIFKAYEEVEMVSWDEDEIARYESEEKRIRDNWEANLLAIERASALSMEKGKEEGIREGMEKGKEEGIKEGIEKGKEKRNKELAKMMLSDGEPLEKIIKYTGVPRSWLVQLQQEVERKK